MKKYILFTTALVFAVACGGGQKNKMKNDIDPHSYNLGIIAGFAELVNCGVKKLALSDVLLPSEADKIIGQAEEIAKRNHVQIHRESDLIRTNLFPEDIAIGKDVLLIYQGSTLDEYLALKEEAGALEKQGKYTGEAKMRISRRFGRLLSYPPYRINELLAENTPYRSMRDFGIKAGNVFFYYENLEEAADFYTRILGLELVADYSMAKILRIASKSYLILVDEKYGMHKTSEPKTVKLSLVTDQLSEWNVFLKEKKVNIKEDLKTTPGSDYFSILDPSGYVIELVNFKQQPANENLLAQTNACESILGNNGNLGFKSSVIWLYYNDLPGAQSFYDEIIGLKQVADWGRAKTYQVSSCAMLGIAGETQEMPFTDKKAVNVSFVLDNIDGWFEYCAKNAPFELRSKEMEVGDGNKYRAFIGYDPQGYYLEFDAFYAHELNVKLMDGLK